MCVHFSARKIDELGLTGVKAAPQEAKAAVSDLTAVGGVLTSNV